MGPEAVPSQVHAAARPADGLLCGRFSVLAGQSPSVGGGGELSLWVHAAPSAIHPQRLSSCPVCVCHPCSSQMCSPQPHSAPIGTGGDYVVPWAQLGSGRHRFLAALPPSLSVSGPGTAQALTAPGYLRETGRGPQLLLEGTPAQAVGAAAQRSATEVTAHQPLSGTWQLWAGRTQAWLLQRQDRCLEVMEGFKAAKLSVKLSTGPHVWLALGREEGCGNGCVHHGGDQGAPRPPARAQHFLSPQHTSGEACCPCGPAEPLCVPTRDSRRPLSSSREMCDQSHNITMCPLCDKTCSYWKMSSACATARASHLFDNPATVFFSIFMALWGEGAPARPPGRWGRGALGWAPHFLLGRTTGSVCWGWTGRGHGNNPHLPAGPRVSAVLHMQTASPTQPGAPGPMPGRVLCS